jgi:hypothetical protein
MKLELANIPVETPDELADKNMFGIRVTEVLARINFPNREKTVISLNNFPQWHIKMNVEATDVNTGQPLNLEHSVLIHPMMSDDQIAAQIFVLMGQFVIHEFMEHYRYNGAVMFNPHLNGAFYNSLIFPAIERIANNKFEPIKLQAVGYETVKLEEKPKTKEKFWHKFYPQFKKTA